VSQIWLWAVQPTQVAPEVGRGVNLPAILKSRRVPPPIFVPSDTEATAVPSIWLWPWRRQAHAPEIGLKCNICAAPPGLLHRLGRPPATSFVRAGRPTESERFPPPLPTTDAMGFVQLVSEFAEV